MQRDTYILPTLNGGSTGPNGCLRSVRGPLHAHDTKTQPFTRQSAIFADTTPFLRDVFSRIAGPDIDSRVAWIIDDLVLLLDRADMASIIADFGRRTRREDPVVHFYEDFLAAYDPELREVRGVYYTPEPVVSYIVRSVDRLLRDRFGLADGLAETARVRGGAMRSHPVLILDPAVGTGTFLREVVARIRETIERKGLSGAWVDYVRHHLLPRLFGFELLMAPYAICHLKLALEIGGTNTAFKISDGQRLGVFLTNTLEEAHGCLRCLLLVMCTYPLAKTALTLYLARGEGCESYFGCNLMQRKVLASSHQHWPCPGFVDTNRGATMRLEASMGKRRRRKFTGEFKKEAVRLFREGERSIGQVAKELDLTESSLRNWVKQYKVDHGEGPREALTTAERDELGSLRRRVRTLEQEREILKKAAAFFAKESE